MISTQTDRIGAILSSGNSRIEVPRYQRDYNWKIDEVTELIDDLKSYLSASDDNLFLGNFIFDDSNQNVKKIIDGQQRLTSISILLVACRTRAYELGKQAQANEIQKKLTFISELDGQSLGSRLIVSPTIRAVYDFMCKSDWSGNFPSSINGHDVRTGSRKVKPVYEYMYNEVKRFREAELTQFLRVIYDSYVIVIGIKNGDDAFEVFERTNSRGMALNIADQIKNYLFSNEEVLDEDVADFWDELVEHSNNNLQRMFKYFWVSHSGYIQNKNLYRKIKAYSKNLGVTEFVRRLHAFSIYYELIQNPEQNKIIDWLNEIGAGFISSNQDYYQKLVNSFEALKLFRITQAYPLIYSLILASIRSELDNTKKANLLIRTIRNIENYHFINSYITESIGNEVEKLYAEMSKAFDTGDFREQSEKLNDGLRSKLVSKEEFISTFSQITYTERGNSVPQMAYIFDRINNFGLSSGQRKQIYFPELENIKINFNRDHFMPQYVSNLPSTPQNLIEALDNIGNILILDRHSNSEFREILPPEKIEKLKDPRHSGTFVYIKDFVQKYGNDAKNWNAEVIYKRAADMAEDAYLRVWAIS